MANTPWVDRTSEEIMSHHVSGLQDAVKNVEQALNMDTEAVVEYGLTLLADADGGYRIAEAAGKRNWLTSPAPVIEKLVATVWETITIGFSIDHAGGAVIFPEDKQGEEYRASFTRVKNTAKNADSIPTGVILMWSGEIVDIPSGWVLCDGNNGTPDLRNRFVMGAGDAYDVGATGGESFVTLTTHEIPSHKHSNSSTGSAGSHSHNTISDHSHTNPSTGSDGSHNHTTSIAVQRTNESSHTHLGTDVSARPSDISTSSSSATAVSLGDSDNHTHSIGSTGSNGGHTHTNTGTAHTHSIGDTGETGTGNQHENKPPYYALAYIMKN